MIHNELTVLINRPVDDVFAHITSLRNFPSFNSALGELQNAAEQRMSVGAEFTMLTRVRGEQTPITFEVTEYDPNKVFGFKSLSNDVLPVSYHYYFEAVGPQTRLYYVEQMESGNVTDQARIKDIERTRREQIERDLQTLKTFFES